MHAIELLPDDAGCDVVRRDWAVLRDAGLPSQLDHRGTTNSPHLTAVAAATLAPAAEERAAGLLGPLLPTEVQTSGIALLGGARVSLVRLVEVPDDLVRAVLDLRREVGDVQHSGWLPHVTLARRIARADVPAALDAIGRDEAVLTITTLRRWDPDAGEVRAL
jgi:hypothetical protein